MAVPFVDVAFPLVGRALPLDHGYHLFAALARVLPQLHERGTWAVHPVRGVRSGPGVLALDPMRSDKRPGSLLKLRLPADALVEVLPLSGAVLQVGEHRVAIGVPRIFSLEPAALIKARYVTLKNHHGEPEPFALALRRQLATLAGLGEDPERIQIVVGPRRVMQVAEHTVVGFAVTLSGLEPQASITVQQYGLGGRRHMGAGIFVPSRHRA